MSIIYNPNVFIQEIISTHSLFLRLETVSSDESSNPSLLQKECAKVCDETGFFDILSSIIVELLLPIDEVSKNSACSVLDNVSQTALACKAARQVREIAVNALEVVIEVIDRWSKYCEKKLCYSNLAQTLTIIFRTRLPLLNQKWNTYLVSGALQEGICLFSHVYLHCCHLQIAKCI